MLQCCIKTSNTILYCKAWESTVRFYRDELGLPIHFATEWFVEFCLTPVARLSIADEKRASIKSSQSKGFTLALEVEDLLSVWDYAAKTGLNPTPIRKHPWNADVFYLTDPEGHRIEIWQQKTSG